jgi:hypothetical protein
MKLIAELLFSVLIFSVGTWGLIALLKDLPALFVIAYLEKDNDDER